MFLGGQDGPPSIGGRFDLSDAKGGMTVLTDSKYGSDKPDDHTLRLTLLYTPGLSANGRRLTSHFSEPGVHSRLQPGESAIDLAF